MTPRLTAVALTAALAGTLAAGCSSGGGIQSLAATGFRAALAHVAATDTTRAYVSYDDTAALVAVAGKDLAPAADDRAHYGQLRGNGVPSLTPYAFVLHDSAGLALFDAKYTISGGMPPNQVGFVSGGQPADQLTKGFTGLGWHQDGNRLVAPGMADIKDDTLGAAVFSLAQLSAADGNLRYGSQSAKLDDIGGTPAHSLADDPLIGALADCLGPVAAATIDARGTSPAKPHPKAIALGLRAPKQKTDTPHLVACAAFGNADDATSYRDRVRKALTTGTSLASNQPWHELLTSPSVADPTGDQHIVAWQADAPDHANLAVDLLARNDLPALADCSRLPPAIRAAHSDDC